MDEIIYLEPDEEITSVIDKLKNAKTKRLGLVVPREATLLQSVVNLRLLEREAEALKKEIAIVTQDKIGRNLAAQVGLQVFNSIEERKPVYQPPMPKPDSSEVIELENPKKNSDDVSGVHIHHFQEKPIEWRRNETPIYRGGVRPPENSKIALPKAGIDKLMHQKQRDFVLFHKIIWPAIAILTVLILIGVYLLLPRATVTLSVPSDDLKKDMVLSVSTSVQSPNVSQNIIPGQLLQATQEKKDTFPATGQKNIGTKASGNITIYNTLDSNGHLLTSGTQLSSSNKTFILKSNVTVPGAGVQGGSIVPGSIKVDIEAQDVGSSFNVAAGRFTILNLGAAQQAGIYGQSTAAMSGGDSRQVQVVSQTDYDAAKNKLLADLTDQTKKDLQTKIGDKQVLDKALVTPDPAITSSAAVGAEAKTFDLDVKTTSQAMVFDEEVLKTEIINILQQQVSADKMVAIASSSDIGLKVTNTSYDKGEMELGGSVLAKVATKIDPDTLKTNLLGKKLQDAEKIISQTPGVSAEKIDFWPALWFKRIPYFSRNVTINVQYGVQ